MATTRLGNTGLQYPGDNEAYETIIDNDFVLLDAMTALGGLCVIAKENPSTTLNVAVSAGNYKKANGTIGTYAGTASFAITLSSTLQLWLTDAGVLTSGASFPSTAHIRLATVVSGATTITSVTDQRVQSSTVGTGLGFVLRAGDTLDDSAATVVFHCGTTHGVEFGGATTDLLAFYGSTPIAQQAATVDLATVLSALGLRASGTSAPLGCGQITIADTKNIVLATGTGTQIGTGSTQKLAFLGATPIAQQANTVDLATVLSALGLRANGASAPLGCGTITIADGSNIVIGTTTGTQIGTGSTQKIGFYGKTPVVQQTQGATVTNSVTSGGTANTIANFTDLTTYSNDSAAIRNDIYQLTVLMKTVIDALRLYGLLS